MARDCDEAARYWSDEMHIEALEYCQKGIIMPDKVKSRCHLIEYKIEEGSRDDTTMGKRIIFSGYFTYLCEEAGNGLQTEDLKLFLREHAGGWEIT